MPQRTFLRGRFSRRTLAWTAFGTFVGADWGVAVAVMIEGQGGVIPTAASAAIVVALALLGAALSFRLVSERDGDA